jgi:O-antigen/teichoic acid export membrane protein/O-antigen ligase
MQRFQLRAVHVATIVALASSVVNQAIMIVSGVLAARLLGVEQRGNLALLVLVPTVLSQLGTLGLPLAVTYWIAGAPHRAAAVVRSVLGVVAAQTVVLCVAHAVILSVLLRDAAWDVRLAGLYTLALIAPTLAYHYGLAVLQGQQRFVPYYGVSLLPGLFYSLAAAGLWLSGNGTVATFALAFMLSWLGSGVAAVVVARLVGVWRTPADHAERQRSAMVRFGLKGLLGSAAPVETFRIDQAIVALLLSPAALGLYVVAMSFANLLRFLSQSIGLIAYPQVAAQTEPPEARRTLWRFFWLATALCVLVAIGLGAVAGWLVPFMFGAEFGRAVPITRVVLLGAVFLGARRVLTDGVRGIGRPVAGTVAEVISWLWLVPALVLFTPRWGAIGVAWALASASAVSLLSLCAIVNWPSRGTAPVGRTWRNAFSRRAAKPLLPSSATLAAVALALAAGVGLPFIPTPLVLGLVAALAGVPLLLVIRAVVVGQGGRSAFPPLAAPLSHATGPFTDGRGTAPAGATVDFRMARLLYYAGVLTIAVLTLRPALGLTLSDWFFFASLGAACLQVLRQRRIDQPLPVALVVGMFLYAAGGLLSSFPAASPVQSVAIVIRMIYLTVAWFWLGAIVLQTPRQIRTAVLLWVVSVAITSGAAIVQAIWGDVVPGSSPNWGRMTGFTPHQNELGAITAVAFIPALSLALTASGRTRLLATVCLLMLSIGEALSGSLGAFAAAGVATLLWLTWARLRLRSLLPFALAGLAVAAVFVAITTSGQVRSPFSRISEVTARDQQNATLWSRVQTYQSALDSIDRDPFVGAGLDSISRRTEGGFEVHNIFLGPWYEAGLLGLLGISVLIVAVILTGRAAIRRAATPDDGALALSLFGAFATFLLYAQTSPALYTRYGWIPVAFLLALRAQQSVRQERPRRVRPLRPVPIAAPAAEPVGVR